MALKNLCIVSVLKYKSLQMQSLYFIRVQEKIEFDVRLERMSSFKWQLKYF